MFTSKNYLSSHISPQLQKSILCITLIFFCFKFINAQTKTDTIESHSINFSSTKYENIDTSSYSEWVDGIESRIFQADKKNKRPEWVLWTDKTEIGNIAIRYGNSKTLSPRHLRFGFYKPIIVGSIFTESGGCPSVLKQGIPYPGDLNDETQWIKAKRLINGEVTDKEALSNVYSIWVFPAGTQTRAIRFSHHPNITDDNYAGMLSGLFVSEKRFFNIANQAQIRTSTNTQHLSLLTNEKNDSWMAWDNSGHFDNKSGVVSIISKDNPEWIILKWPQPVSLCGLAAIATGFSTSDVQFYSGNTNGKIDFYNESNWQTIKKYDRIMADFSQFRPNILDFGQTILTTAVRLKITSSIKNSGYLQTETRGGKRIFLGELMALQPLGNAQLQSTKILTKGNELKPSIAIPFTLNKAGYVTLVIEDSSGIRIRNLVSDTWFNAGKNTVWWDGLDDLGRDLAAANHAIYRIPAKLVAQGSYKVRGILHGEINTTFEFSVYTAGNPAWGTYDHTGGWLANHTAPQSALYVPAKQSPTHKPAVILGCYVTEGPDGIAWVDLDGKKLGGKHWVGGIWTAAPYLARDASDSAAKDIYAYVACVWEAGEHSGIAELRINALTTSGDKKIIQYPVGKLPKNFDMLKEIGGFAVNRNIAVMSRPAANELLFINLNSSKVIDSLNVSNPHGLAYDSQGRLLVLSDNKLLRFDNLHSGSPETIISADLDKPVAITLDYLGNFYISNGGQSNQIKRFSVDGKLINTIGTPGLLKAGIYDSLHLNNPIGLTIDSLQHLWVAENDFLPKRVSVWTLDGKFIKAFYGPAKYGGGGTLDGHDKNKFYYAEGNLGAMEFELDWKSGTNRLKKVYYRNTSESLKLPNGNAAPETPLYCNGKRYFTNCYNSNPTNGHLTSVLFVERDGKVIPAAAMGKTEDWSILSQLQFEHCFPFDVISFKGKQRPSTFFIWSDLNEDGQVQPQEVTIKKGATGGVTVMEDLSFCFPIDGNATKFIPNAFSNNGTPFYTINNSKILSKGVLNPPNSGGGQILSSTGGKTVAMEGIMPFNPNSVCGAKDGKATWSYPDVWPGLDAAKHAPLPTFSGELIGCTRLLGGFMNFKGAESDTLWAVNSNHGMIYIFTSDGLFVTTLFKPMRTGKQWKMPVALRGMNVNEMTLDEENFWPTITKTEDDEVYLVDGGRTSIIKVDGLKNIQHLPEINIRVTNEDLRKCSYFQIEKEAQRQKNDTSGLMKIKFKIQLKVDGNLDEWTNAQWVDIDKSGIYSTSNNSQSITIQGALMVSDTCLFIGYKTGDNKLLENSGAIPIAPFKTGGGLDLMLGTFHSADKNRINPVAGDMRLLISMIKGKPKAILYQAKVGGTKDSDKIPFSSPWRTITFDKVEDITSKILFAARDGNYEVSIPLAVLNLKLKDGMELKGDIGILRGDGTHTTSRTYWNNKATSIVSDVPSEAELTPSLWGTFQFLGH